MEKLKNMKNEELKKHKKLVQTFLLYNFLKLSQAEKKKFFKKQIPEVILRTMKLEGEKISRRDIERIR